MDKSQVRAARALLGWTQEDLARAARVSVPTVRRIETGNGAVVGAPDIVSKIEGALQLAGIEFTGGIRSSGRLSGLGVSLRQISYVEYARFQYNQSARVIQMIEELIRLDRNEERTKLLEEAMSILETISQSLRSELETIEKEAG